MRARMLLAAVLAGPAVTAFACSDLGGLTGGNETDAGLDVASEPPDAGATSDSSVEDSAIPDLPDVFVNPTAGLGIFVLHGIPSDAGIRVAPARIEPGDSGMRLLQCPVSGVPEHVVKVGQNPDALGPWAMRTFHDPVDPGRAKFVFPSGPFGSNTLLMVTTDSACDGGTAARDIGAGVTGGLMSPSFNDDGKRVAFLATNGVRVTRVVTASTEGTLTQHELRSISDDSAIVISTAPPAWVRDVEGLKVAWVETNEEGSIVVRLALDGAQGIPPLLLDCGAAFYGIYQIAFFGAPGGKTLIAFDAQLSDPDGGGPSQRAIYAVDYRTSCSARTLLFDDAPGSFSGDFTMAPDGERMAHVANRAIDADAGIERRRIWIGKVSTRQRKACSDPPPGSYDVGPQWIKNGTQIAWTRRSGGSTAAVMLADVAGDVCTNARVISVTSGNEVSHTAKNDGCAVSPGRTPHASGALALFLGLTAALRARRRAGRSSFRQSTFNTIFPKTFRSSSRR